MTYSLEMLTALPSAMRAMLAAKIGGVARQKFGKVDSTRRRFLGEPAVTPKNPSREKREFIGYDRTYDITSNWSLTNRFAFNAVNFKDRSIGYDSIDETTGLIQRFVFDGIAPHRRTFSSNLDLNGKFDTGLFNLAVLLGLDYFSFQDEVHGFNSDISSLPSAAPINLFFPAHYLTDTQRVRRIFSLPAIKFGQASMGRTISR